MSSDGDFDDGEICLFPITDIGDMDYDMSMGGGGDSGGDADHSDDSDEPMPPPRMSLRERRRSRALALPKLNLNSFSKPSFHIEAPPAPVVTKVNKVAMRWKRAIQMVKKLKDPWAQFCLDSLETETAIRHRYSALKKKWVEDEVQVKMETKQFNHGAMRNCFRLKKLSNFSRSGNWKHALNYVAKHYIDDVDRDVYFEDVRLQMDAKLWGEEYNRHNPPKKVDIFQMYVLEFKNREGCPLFHLEHYIEGHYIKYNSNSGFVDESVRFTPQAFSHFTFERSGHNLIIVDIQGVGDLYTDPQIHTVDGKGYGDGNLGTKGMALFFHSHICNNICESLGLSVFDLAPTELSHHRKYLEQQVVSMAAATMVRGKEELCMSPSPHEKVDLTAFLSARSRSRNTSSCSNFSLSSDAHSDDLDSPRTDTDDEPMCMSPASPPIRASILARVRFQSESDRDTLTELGREEQMRRREEEREAFQRAMNTRQRASCFAAEINLRSLQNHPKIGDSILGQQLDAYWLEQSVLGEIHHDMAKYHELERFCDTPDNIDWPAAIYHEEHAAQLGVLEAINTLAKMYLGMTHDVLQNCTCEQNEENLNRGMDYMLMAAEAGDRRAMVYMARAYDTGNNLGTMWKRDWEEAFHWYDEAINCDNQDESGEFDATMDDPVYLLQARQAEMVLEGAHGLERNPQQSGDLYTEAADNAMAAMKGRLANKYYMLAEEAWGEVEE